MPSEAIEKRNEHLGGITMLFVGAIFAASKFGAPVWALPILGLVLGIPFAMLRDKKVGMLRLAAVPFALALRLSILGIIIIGAFGALAFLAKALLALGPPTARELAILASAIVMLVSSSLVTVNRAS